MTQTTFDTTHDGLTLYALFRPDGSLSRVIAAMNPEEAWGFRSRKMRSAEGWRMYPVTVSIIGADQDRPRVLTDEQRAEYDKFFAGERKGE